MTSRRMLILDFDGVLVDSEPAHYASWNQAFQELLNIRHEGSYHALVGLRLDEIYQLWAEGMELSAEVKQQLLTRKTELFFSTEQKAMPGSMELVRKAHTAGWYIAIASRAKRLRLHRTLELIGMPPLFDLILGTEDVVDQKTDRKDHARAPRMFGIDPAHCVVIEDSVSGVTDACRSGIGRVLGYTSSVEAAALRAAGAHEVVDHLSDVQL